MKLVASILLAIGLTWVQATWAQGTSARKNASKAATARPELDVSASKDYPMRRAGLWEMRTTAAHAAGLPNVSFCVGETTDTTLEHLDRTFGVKGSCKITPFRAVGQAWVSESVCKEGRTFIESKSIASGDLLNSYRIDTQTTYVVSLSGSSPSKKEESEALEAKYLGPCLSSMRVGDLSIAGMGKINMRDGAVTVPKPPRATKKNKRA